MSAVLLFVHEKGLEESAMARPNARTGTSATALPGRRVYVSVVASYGGARLHLRHLVRGELRSVRLVASLSVEDHATVAHLQCADGQRTEMPRLTHQQQGAVGIWDGGVDGATSITSPPSATTRFTSVTSARSEVGGVSPFDT